MATTMTIPYLMWADDNPKRTIDQKVKEACEAFTARFRGAIPTVILISSDEPTMPVNPPVPVRVVKTVRRNNYWVGREEGTNE